ncbi:Uncharacterised protein [Kocuria rhizophila]|uniref:Uncharacterized protein n=2 Tax=Micrococcaceae TaxID=1268 RepID=B2GIP9_KOCRD|nr:hypothetical protein KRH_13950 [Kocuria rhizophila DC2201]VEH74982.1 Uncharacterised protein [Kocuria rhizophila]
MGAMREQRLKHSSVTDHPVMLGHDERYEYLSLTVAPREHPSEARTRVKEHAEYGKWELMRSAVLYGGARRYVMRRRIMRVDRTM